LVAGALSMAAGEYVSVSTQRDTERALLAKEIRELAEEPEEELAELAGIYRSKGLSDELAMKVAVELTEHDALAAHADVELGINPNDLTSPWQAASASLIAFCLGAAIPLLTIMIFGSSVRTWATAVAVAFALALTGFGSARFAEAEVGRAVLRNILGGLIAMGITYGIGILVGQYTG
jgi:VIT1/CCC1 family predicted Fe2+/Mn2+ transporter